MRKSNRLRYRMGVGIMLINKQARVFIGQRRSSKQEIWQMPQGGIDRGEDPLAAALRELLEETGVHEVKVLSETSQWYAYDLPKQFRRGQYCGQKQKWFLMQFLGADEDIRLDMHHPEFKNWRWIEHVRLVDLIVDFKRDVYKNVLQEFSPILEGMVAEEGFEPPTHGL